jgi:branched-chain amino acid transport system ATP-binding protein
MVAGPPQTCLNLVGVSKQYGARRVLTDLQLAVGEQEIVGIIGPNGAGKTTLFNVICGQVRPTRGAIYLHGGNITNWAPHRICHAGIARTFQIAKPFPEMSALENVGIGLRFGKLEELSYSERRDRALELLDWVGLANKVTTPAGQLTLSEQRRLEVARALATRPHVLLLDEIAAGLSPQAVKAAVDMVEKLRARGLTLLIIDHFLNLTVRVSDRIMAMDRGEKIIEGTPSEVMNHPEVISAYLGERHRLTPKEAAA